MDIRHLTVFVYRARFFLRQSPSDVKQEEQMSSILDDQLRLMALKQYGLIKSIKTPDISEEDLRLILKNTENKTIKFSRYKPTFVSGKFKLQIFSI